MTLPKVPLCIGGSTGTRLRREISTPSPVLLSTTLLRPHLLYQLVSSSVLRPPLSISNRGRAGRGRWPRSVYTRVRMYSVISFMSNSLSFLMCLWVRCWVGLALRVPGLRWEEGGERPAVVGRALGSVCVHFDLPAFHCFLLV